jgi:PAS domain S-box-containing protein
MADRNDMTKEQLLQNISYLEECISEMGIFKALFDHAPCSIILTSEAGNIIDCNKRALDNYNYLKNEMCVLSIADILSVETADKLPELFKEEIKSDGMVVKSYHKKKNGEIFPVEMVTKLVTIDNNIFRLVITRPLKEIDFTPQKPDTSETPIEYLSNILPEMTGEPEIVFESDVNGIITSANPVFYHKTGYSEQDIQKGLKINHFFFSAEPKKDIFDGKHFSAEKMKLISEYNLLCRDGAIIPVLGLLKKIIATGKETRFRIHAFDISEQKRFEHNLKMMEKLNALGETAGAVIHDFNNILSIIIGNVDILDKCADLSSLHEITKKIRLAANDGAEIVQRLKNFSQIYIQHNDEPVNINKAIIETIDFLKPKWYNIPLSQGITISIDTDLKTVPDILATVAEIREVLSNIILNAIEAMPEGGTITIKTEHVENFIILSISDTGTGMSSETKKHLFEPFFTTDKSKGTGLGLSVSYGIIKKFGGNISVESKLNEGSTFTITLPVIKPKTIKKEKANLGHHEGISRDILVIDDEENICALLKEFLNKEGYNVTVAVGGDKGFEMVKKHAFPIIITDLNMPKISGWELARYVKLKNPETIIIMLSGWEETIQELNAKEPTIDFILQKPVSFNKLSEFISKIRNEGM